MSQKLAPYVIFPRKIAADYRNGIITKDELLVYTWIRLNATPYGVSTTSLSDVSHDLFKGEKTENSINKILLSLKQKRYIFYKRRVGHRGSFEMHLGDFILPRTKVIRTLDKLFEDEAKENQKHEQSLNPTEQKPNLAETIIKSMRNKLPTTKQSRACNTDTNKEKENETDESTN